MKLRLLLAAILHCSGAVDRSDTVDPFELRSRAHGNWTAASLRPVESLAFCRTPREVCEKAAEFRRRMVRRPLFRWREARPGPIRVFAKETPWFRKTEIRACPVACEYATSLSDADATLANLRAIHGPRTTATGVLSYESCGGTACLEDRGNTVAMSYSRYGDVVYEFYTQADVDWAARPTPPRPAKPSSAVFISNCAGWRMRYLADLDREGVSITHFGKCNRTRWSSCRGTAKTWHHCKLDELAKHPFALTFENLLLDDYVTEKWIHAWRSGAVPVYAGSPLVYQRIPEWPPFINVLDFESPRHLADYLRLVLANDTLWHRYTARATPPPAVFDRWGRRK